jgi:hypothetical protein
MSLNSGNYSSKYRNKFSTKLNPIRSGTFYFVSVVLGIELRVSHKGSSTRPPPAPLPSLVCLSDRVLHFCLGL